MHFRLGRADLEGLRVAVQGVGGVGYHLCALLARAGARLLVADVRQDMLQRVGAQFGAAACAPEAILGADVEVFAPCALGAILDAGSIPRLRAQVIAGAANNQLARDADGAALAGAGILYAPDYVINAGGIISVSREYHGAATEAQVLEDIQRIRLRLTQIFERARSENRPTHQVADQMARERLARARAG